MSDVSDLHDLLTELNDAIQLSSQDKDNPLPIRTIRRLLREHPELAGMVSNSDGLGEYPLHRAAHHGSGVALDELIAAGADVNAVSHNRFRQTPLHLAARQGHEYACELLAKAGANLTQREANGWTPLMEAIHARHPAAIGQLIMLGAPVDLRAAVNLRQPAVVRLMLRDNPGLVHEEPDAADLVAEAVLWGKGNTDVLRLLLEAGANPNTYGEMHPPLYLALWHEDRAATELLVAHGADPDRRIKPSIPAARAQAEKEGLDWALELFSRAKGNQPTG
jgi:ankyrin repeat protein